MPREALVPTNDSDLFDIEDVIERGTDYSRLEHIIGDLITQVRKCRRRLRAARIGTAEVWHWSQKNEISGCSKMRVGDISTDFYAEKVNCPRCSKLKTRLTALARRAVAADRAQNV